MTTSMATPQRAEATGDLTLALVLVTGDRYNLDNRTPDQVKMICGWIHAAWDNKRDARGHLNVENPDGSSTMLNLRQIARVEVPRMPVPDFGKGEWRYEAPKPPGWSANSVLDRDFTDHRE